MKRVFILSSGSMFGEGVRRLLGREAELEIVGSETNLSAAIERIGELQPDVVILDQGHWVTELALDLIKLRERGAEIKVIGLSLQSNALFYYSREIRIVQRVQDLLEAIK